MTRWATLSQMRAVRRAHIADRFKDHRAELRVLADGVEEIRWRRPGTGIDSLSFLIHGPHLIVAGDLGDAIYTRECGWQFWATCDLDYFASKCVASDTGRLAREWNGDRAEICMADVLGTTVDGLRDSDVAIDGAPTDADADEDVEARDEDQLSRFRERDGASALHSEYDWVSWLRDHGDDVFGADYFEYGEAGRDVSYRCAFHLEGVKAAVRQLGLLEQERAA